MHATSLKLVTMVVTNQVMPWLSLAKAKIILQQENDILYRALLSSLLSMRTVGQLCQLILIVLQQNCVFLELIPYDFEYTVVPPLEKPSS